NGRPPLEAVPQRPPVEDRIFGEAAGRRVEITAIRSLKRPAHKLNQVGGRGLLGHRREYPCTATSARLCTRSRSAWHGPVSWTRVRTGAIACARWQGGGIRLGE